MGRIWATVALCLVVCVSPASAAAGGRTIAQAPGVTFGKAVRGQLYDGAFYSGYSVAFWTASLVKGDRMTIRTRSAGGDPPPCQILYLPGTDDRNVGATTPLLDPASQTRDGSREGQRLVAATETGTYVLAMTNADIFLSGPHQCLDAPAGRPFTFTVSVAHRGSVAPSSKKGEEQERIVRTGQSLWVIAQGLVARPASIAEIAFEVEHLWQLNRARIGTGDPDLIYPGLRLRLR
jgi:hypothetical protein